MALRFVDLETARQADGLRAVLLGTAPSPWSQAVKAIVDLDGVDGLGVWKRGKGEDIALWTGLPNAPVVLYGSEPPRTGYAEILCLIERLSRAPRLIPADAERRVRMFGLSHELMGERGLLWNSRLVMVAQSLESGGAQGWPLPVAQHLGKRYGYSPGCGEAAERAMLACIALLDAQLAANGPYYFGEQLSALDVYSATVVDTLLPLPHEQCPMHPVVRSTLEGHIERLRGAPIERMVEHRDMMHARHMPLPIEL
jgi:glutathione S-transferase